MCQQRSDVGRAVTLGIGMNGLPRPIRQGRSRTHATPRLGVPLTVAMMLAVTHLPIVYAQAQQSGEARPVEPLAGQPVVAAPWKPVRDLSPSEAFEFCDEPLSAEDLAPGMPQRPLVGGGNWESADDSPAFWLRPELLMWWVDGWYLPPVVTRSPGGVSRDAAGVLGKSTTEVLAGGQRVLGDMRLGGRVDFGFWIDPLKTVALEANYFGLENLGRGWSAGSDGIPALARPFYNVEPGFEGQAAELVAYQGVLQGHVEVSVHSALQGTEILLRRRAGQDVFRTIDVLAGWRFVRLDESLYIHDFKTSLNQSSGMGVGTTVDEFDRFATSSSFQGAELGLSTQIRRNRFAGEFTAKLALGNAHSRVRIDGGTTVTVPRAGGTPDINSTSSGLLAQDSNSGVYEDDDLAVLPELGATLGFQVTPRLQATFAYTFLYWNSVFRPGDQIDRSLNLSQLEDTGLNGPARPRYTGVKSDLWAAGLNFGLDYRY
jgi:hypothetical protein